MTDSGGHALGIEPTALDADQHGISQNTIDETKATFGRQTVDKDIGGNRPEDGTSGGTLTNRVDDLLSGSGGTDNNAAAKKATTVDVQGMKVGDELEGEDQHNLAARKQP